MLWLPIIVVADNVLPPFPYAVSKISHPTQCYECQLFLALVKMVLSTIFIIELEFTTIHWAS